MRRPNQRMAGAKLAVLPIEDVTADLREALHQLETAPGVKGLNWSEEVPGIDARVDINISPVSPSYVINDDAALMGNAADVRRLKELNSPGVVSLSWSSDRPAGRNEKVRVARFANEMWQEALKDLPDGTIVMNSPVGASSGDFERADLYARMGFGPVQLDGQQIGFMKGGEIQPLSPFVADPSYLEALGRRAKAAGKTELDQKISKALAKRKELDIYDKAQSSRAGKYSYEDDYDYDYDDYEREPLTREEYERRVKAAAQPNDSQNSSVPPEIRIRQAAETPSWAEPNAGDYSATPADLELIRQAQVDALQTPSTARDQADAILQYADRRLPGEPALLDRGFFNSDRILEQIQELPPEQRRAAVIDEIINRQASNVSTTGFDHDAAVIRDLAKQATMNVVDNPNGNGLIAQELYSTDDVAALRRWQEAQALNFPVSNGVQTPPPTLGPNGQIISERLSPPDAVVVGSSPSMLSPTTWRQELLPDMEVVEHRRLMTPQEQVAMQELETLQSIGNQRPDIARAVDGLNDAVNDRQMRIGTVLRELYDGDIPQLERRMKATPAANATDPEQVARDLQTIRNAYQQPGRIEGDQLAQSLANLRQVNGEPLTPAQRQRVQELQGQVSGVARGPAAPINRVYLQRDVRPNEYGHQRLNNRW